MPFDLTSPVVTTKKDSKQNSYPTGVKYPVTCLYCSKKWLVEMGATNLICACGNQLHVLEKVSRFAYEDLKNKVLAQLMSHYDKFHVEILAKAKEENDKKLAAEAAAKAAAATKAAADSSAADTTLSATVNKSDVGNNATVTSTASNISKSNSSDVSPSEIKIDVNDSAIADNASKKRKISEVEDSNSSTSKSSSSNINNETSKRPKLDLLDTHGKTNSALPSNTVKLTGDDLKKKSPLSLPEGSPKAMGSVIGGGVNRKLSGSPRVGGKTTTLIVQCPKCERNVIVPKVASKVFQCPCGQYMTIQQQHNHNHSPRAESLSTATGNNNISKNNISTTAAPAAKSNTTLSAASTTTTVTKTPPATSTSVDANKVDNKVVSVRNKAGDPTEMQESKK